MYFVVLYSVVERTSGVAQRGVAAAPFPSPALPLINWNFKRRANDAITIIIAFSLLSSSLYTMVLTSYEREVRNRPTSDNDVDSEAAGGREREGKVESV